METILLLAMDDGDSSVGIPETRFKLDTNLDASKMNTDERERTRKATGRYIQDTFDPIGRLSVWFDDECEECLSIKDKHGCPNEHCVNCTTTEDFESGIATIGFKGGEEIILFKGRGEFVFFKDGTEAITQNGIFRVLQHIGVD